MAKIGKIKASLDQEFKDGLTLTVDEVGALVSLLNQAITQAESLDTEKVEGVITLVEDGKKAFHVGTAKIKKATEDTDD